MQLHESYYKINKPIIIADQIRTPENMGSILRLAGNIGALKTFFISDVAHTFKNYKISKTASGAADKVDWKIISKEDLLKHLPSDYSLVALETTTDATSIYDFRFPEKTAFVIGNEVKGISTDILKLSVHKVYVPVPGPISSLNVSHALSVGLFEWFRQIRSVRSVRT
jgi:tRNA G18 (ribose-2'-O)-methylase SpoU